VDTEAEYHRRPQLGFVLHGQHLLVDSFAAGTLHLQRTLVSFANLAKNHPGGTDVDARNVVTGPFSRGGVTSGCRKYYYRQRRWSARGIP
jgi:hypothetical protein